MSVIVESAENAVIATSNSPVLTKGGKLAEENPGRLIVYCGPLINVVRPVRKSWLSAERVAELHVMIPVPEAENAHTHNDRARNLILRTVNPPIKLDIQAFGVRDCRAPQPMLGSRLLLKTNRQ